MPIKPLQLTFTPAQQAVRARLATLNPTQFVALTSVLQQVASAIDIRIAQLDAERARLVDQKSKLSTLLTEFAKPSALEHLRKTILDGHKFVPLKLVSKKPKKPKTPGP
jgi:hypothetical protein